jgi:hypothetical protein
MGTPMAGRHCGFFHFSVSGLPAGVNVRLLFMNVTAHQSLYKFDMRPVFRSNSTGNKWIRIRNPVNFEKVGDVGNLWFEHHVDHAQDKIYFCFTYPYTYDMVQQDLIESIDNRSPPSNSDDIYCMRELLTYSLDGRRVDLVTITSNDGMHNKGEREDLLPGLFPTSSPTSPISDINS